MPLRTDGRYLDRAAPDPRFGGPEAPGRVSAENRSTTLAGIAVHRSGLAPTRRATHGARPAPRR